MFTPSKVVICGAGLHGSALAYYLTKSGHTDVRLPTALHTALHSTCVGHCARYVRRSRRGPTGTLQVTIVEREGVGCAASGKGGGFLARDWGSGPTEQLHRVSFDLHAELARDLNVTSYRKIQVTAVVPCRCATATWAFSSYRRRPNQRRGDGMH
jgi:glycine/D-amino acid oxidase-like deaminating enzyme